MISIHYQIIRSLSWVGYWPVKRIYQVLTLIFLIFQNFLNSDKVTPAHRKPNFERLANAGAQSKIDFRSQILSQWYYFRSTSRKKYGTGSRSLNQTWHGGRIFEFSNFSIYSCKLKQIMNYDGRSTAVMNTGYTKIKKPNSQKDSRIPFGQF